LLGDRLRRVATGARRRSGLLRWHGWRESSLIPLLALVKELEVEVYALSHCHLPFDFVK
jgi:hypothetical protein